MTCKLRYDLESISHNKSEKYEFYDFCPKVFHLIRKFFGITSDIYLQSIGPEQLFGSINMGNI